MRRSMILLLALGCFATVVSVVAYADDVPMTHTSHTGPWTSCAKACGECAMHCDMCGAHCAQMLAEGKKEHLTSLQTCQDCAAICGTSACIMARSGPYSADICKVCADVCKKCGDTCAQMKGDEMMQKCSDECRRCEKACRDMLASTGSH